MDPEILFTVANGVALAGWAVLAVAPGWRWGPSFVTAIVVPGLLGLLYVALLVVPAGGSEGGGFGSLAEVAVLFSNPWGLLAGWVHYLVFDLFIGSWEVRDARREGISHLLVLPCLALTCLFGPSGLLLYLVVRGVTRRRLRLGAAS